MRPSLALAIGIGAAAFAVFAPTIRYQFVYDDATQILGNPWIWNPRHLPDLLTQAVWSFKGDQPSNYYRPVQMLLYFFDAQLFGRSPFWFHFTNVLVHALASVAGFRLLGRVTTLGRAALAGLLFAVHPVHVESVAWVAGSTDVNCALFMFGALLAWERARRSRAGVAFAATVLSAALFFFALLAKETAIVLPLLAFWLPRCEGSAGPNLAPSAPMRPGRWLPAAILFGGSVASYLGLRSHALGGLWDLVRHREFSPVEILSNALALLPRYFLVALFPWRPVPDRVFDPVTGLGDPRTLAGIALAGGAVALALLARRRSPALMFGLALLILPLVPVLQVQWVGINVQADRYLYIPALGACLLLAELSGRLLARTTSPPLRQLLRAGCAAVVLLAAVRTLTASRIWRDDETLARSTIALEPRSINMRHLLAVTLDRSGRTEEAYRVAAEAAALDRVNPAVAVMEAVLRVERAARDPADEVALLEEVAKAYPAHPYVWGRLSSACLRARLFERALSAAEMSLRIDPSNAEVIVNLASARGALGDFAGQERQARRALEINPALPIAWMSLAEARLGQRDLDGYEDAVRHAVRLDPALARARLGLSILAWSRGRLEEAQTEAVRALELDRHDPQIWVWLGVIKEQRGDREGARLAWRRALEISPGLPSAQKRLQGLDPPGPATPGRP